MARSVGNIEVTVDADTGKLKAQIVKASKEAGEAGGEAIEEGLSDIDSKELMARIRKIKAQIQEAMAGIEADIDLEADVQRDLRRIQEQVRQTQIELILTPDFDDAELQAILTEVRTKLANAVELEVDLQLNEDQAREVVLEAQAALELVDAELDVGLGISEAEEAAFKAEMRQALYEAEAEAESINVELDVELRTALAVAEAEALAQEIEELEAEIEVELETAEATLELFGFVRRAENETIKLEIETEVDRFRIARDMALLEATFRDIHPDIEPDFDPTSAENLATKAELAAWAGDVGGDIGDDMGGAAGDGFISGFGGHAAMITGAILAVAEPAFTAIEGLAGVATAVTASGISAIGGAAGGAAGNVAAFGAAAAAAVVGSQGFGDALGAINDEYAEAKREGRDMHVWTGPVGDALANLTPNARNAALAFAGIRDELDRAQDEVQEELFSGLDTVITNLGTTALPDMTGALVIAAGSLNEFVTDLAEAEENVDWVGTMKELDPALDNAFDAATLLFGVMDDFLKTTGPAATTLSGDIESAADDFSRWILMNPQKLEDFFTEGAESLETWMTTLFGIGGLLGTILIGGKEHGDRFIDMLGNLVRDWDAWLEGPEGKSALETFLDNAEETVLAMQPLFDGLGDAIADIAGDPDAAENFKELMQALGEGAPALGDLLELLGEIGLLTALGNILHTLGPVFELFNKIPDDVLEAVGVFTLMVAVVSKLDFAFKSLNATAKAGWIGGIALALTGIVLAVDAFTGSEAEAEARTSALSAALGANLDDALQNVTTSTNEATVGLDNFNKTLTEGEEGEKFAQSLATIGRQADDARETLMAMAVDPVAELEKMITEFAEVEGVTGATGDQINALARIVHGSDTNWENMARSMDRAKTDSDEASDAFGDLGFDILETGQSFESFAEKTGFTEEQLSRLLPALENIEDQIDENDQVMQKMAQSELERAAAGSTAERAALAQAAAELELDGTLSEITSKLNDDTIPLYDLYAKNLTEAAQKEQEVAAGNLAGASSYEIINAQIQEGIAASREKAAALREEREAALETFRAEETAARQLKEAVQDVALREFAVPEGLAEGFQTLGDNARDAADAADDLSTALDLLFRPFVNHQEALDAAVQGIADLQEQAKGYTEDSEGNREAIEGWTNDLTGQSQAARDNREAMFGAAEGILSYAEEATAAGEPTETILEHLGNLRTDLESTAESFDRGGLSVEDYVNQLIGTPEELETIVSQPGLIEALANYDSLTIAQNQAGDPVILEFENEDFDLTAEQTQTLIDMLERLGIPVEMSTEVVGAEEAKIMLGEFEVQAQQIDGTTYTPYVSTMEIEPAVDTLAQVQDEIALIDVAEAYPHVSAPGATFVIQELEDGRRQMEVLDDSEATPYVYLPGMDITLQDLGYVKESMINLDGTTATATVNAPGAAPAAQQVNDLATGVTNLNDTTGEPTIYVPSIITAEEGLGTVESEFENLDAVTAEPTVDVLASQVVTLVLLAAIKTLLDDLNDDVVDPTLQLSDYPEVTGMIVALGMLLIGLDRMVADPDVKLDNYETVRGQIATLAIGVANLSFMVGSPDVRLDNYDTVMRQIDNIQANIDALHGRTVTITTQHVTTGAPAMAGTIVTSPQTRLVGERGYAEAIIPLDLPLNRVSPEVRELAAMVRSNALPSLGPARPQRGGASINQYFTLASADPAAVATQALNRAAAMAAS